MLCLWSRRIRVPSSGGEIEIFPGTVEIPALTVGRPYRWRSRSREPRRAVTAADNKKKSNKTCAAAVSKTTGADGGRSLRSFASRASVCTVRRRRPRCHRCRRMIGRIDELVLQSSANNGGNSAVFRYRQHVLRPVAASSPGSFFYPFWR